MTGFITWTYPCFLYYPNFNKSLIFLTVFWQKKRENIALQIKSLLNIFFSYILLCYKWSNQKFRRQQYIHINKNFEKKMPTNNAYIEMIIDMEKKRWRKILIVLFLLNVWINENSLFLIKKRMSSKNRYQIFNLEFIIEPKLVFCRGAKRRGE